MKKNGNIIVARFGLSPSGELLVEWVMGFRITKHPELKEEYDKLQNIEGRKI